MVKLESVITDNLLFFGCGLTLKPIAWLFFIVIARFYKMSTLLHYNDINGKMQLITLKAFQYLSWCSLWILNEKLK